MEISVTPTVLAAGTYWLGFLPDNNGLVTRKNSSGTAGYFKAQAYGPLSNPFGAPGGTYVTSSMYAGLNASAFTITSADATDTSTVAWHILEPA